MTRALYYDSKIVASDGSQEVALKGRWLLTDDVSNVKKTLNDEGDNYLSEIYFEYGGFVNEDGVEAYPALKMRDIPVDSRL